MIPSLIQDVFDTDGDGTISFSEFVHSIPSLLQEEVTGTYDCSILLLLLLLLLYAISFWIVTQFHI